MERVLRRIFHFMDICGNKRMLINHAMHMSDPSDRGGALGWGGAGGGRWEEGSFPGPDSVEDGEGW